MKPTFRTFRVANDIAEGVGEKWGLTIQLNFPAGKARSKPVLIGRENLSLLVETGQKKFRGVTEADVRTHLEQLDPDVRVEPPGHGYEGFRAFLANDMGRIDCLPGGVHLWCEITPGTLQFLDWLFENAYGIRPS